MQKSKMQKSKRNVDRRVVRGQIAAVLATALIVGEVPYAGAAETSAKPEIEEVLVTARKRTESLQDVPISIDAFSSEMLEARGVESIFDLAKLAPNLSFNQQYGRMLDRPVIRGMSQLLGDRTVGFVVDGVYIAGDLSGTDFDDVESIEVLKGPQAAAYGRGSLAGVISYRTRRPQQYWTGSASVSGGDDGFAEATGVISGPIIADTLSFRLGGRYYNYDGQYKGITNEGGQYRFGSEHTNRVSGSLLWEPTEAFDLLIRAFAGQNKDGLYSNNLFQERNCYVTTDLSGRQGSYCGVVPTIPASGAGLEADLRDAQRQGHPGTMSDVNLYNVEANWRTSLVDITGLVSWNRQDDDIIIDDYLINAPSSALASQIPGPTMTNAWPGGIARIITIREYRSQELRFASSADVGPRWLLGLYHYDEHRKGFSGYPTYNVLVGGVPSPANNGPVGTLRSISQPISPFFIDNKAIFGSVTFDLGQRWHASLEGRYARDTLATDNSVQVVPAPNPSGRGTYCSRRLEAEFTSFTPRGTLQFDVADNANVYASISKGTKPGTFNTSLCSTNYAYAEAERLNAIAPIQVEEEEALNYEIGTKMRLLGGRVALDAAIFYIDWTNQHVITSHVATNAITGLVGGTSLTINAGKTSIKGFEVNSRYAIDEHWNVFLGWGYSDATYDELCDSTFAQLVGQTVQAGVCAGASSLPTRSVAGYQTANTPKNTGNFGVEYSTVIGGDWQVFARMNASYQSERFAEVYNGASTGDATRFDTRVSVERDKWAFTVWGRNVGNERAPDGVQRGNNPDTNARTFTVHYPNGRQLGLTATYRF